VTCKISEKIRAGKPALRKIFKTDYYLYLGSDETESFFLPFALRAASTLLPFGVDILSLKPCLLALFLLDG